MGLLTSASKHNKTLEGAKIELSSVIGEKNTLQSKLDATVDKLSEEKKRRTKVEQELTASLWNEKFQKRRYTDLNSELQEATRRFRREYYQSQRGVDGSTIEE